MKETSLKQTLEFLLNNMDDSVLLTFGKKLNTSGNSKKINKKYKIVLIGKMLNSKNLSATCKKLKGLKFTDLYSKLNKNAELYEIAEHIYNNFLVDENDKNITLISNYQSVFNKKIAESNISSLDKESEKDRTIDCLNQKIKLLQSKLKNRDRKIDTLKIYNSKKDDDLKKLKDDNKTFIKKNNENIELVRLNKIYENEIVQLNNKILELSKLNQQNSKYYKKQIKSLKSSLKKIQTENYVPKNDSSKKAVKHIKPSEGTAEDEKVLLIQAPSDGEIRRKLRISNIEIIESDLFCTSKDNFGESFKNVEDIPKILKYDIAKYKKIYLFKEHLAIGDRDKLKKMFGSEKVKEIDNVEEILK